MSKLGNTVGPRTGFISSFRKGIFTRNLFYTATKIPFMYSYSGNCAASVPISHSFFSERFIYSQDRSTYSCSRIGRPILGIYKSITDLWMWKLGWWPRNFLFWDICFEFWVLVLCGVLGILDIVSLFSSYLRLYKICHALTSLVSIPTFSFTVGFSKM